MRFTVVDAFASRPFEGNPAAVYVLDEPADPAWMQRVAAEMNLSETAFAHPDAGGFRLRWFTPTVEVDLCGHATLATAHALWEAGRLRPDQPALFETRSGLLTCRRRDGWIAMDFPAEPVVETPLDAAEQARLGIPLVFSGRNRMDLLVALESAQAVAVYRPDLVALGQFDVRGVILTAPGEPGMDHDFVSRFFAPRAGVPEDPVTGSAHCALGPFWAARLGRQALVGRQVSARGGTVRVRVDGSRVELSGQAVTVVRGELMAGPA